MEKQGMISPLTRLPYIDTYEAYLYDESVVATAAWPEGSAAGLVFPAVERLLVARPADRGRPCCPRRAEPFVTVAQVRPREERRRFEWASRFRAGGYECVKGNKIKE